MPVAALTRTSEAVAVLNGVPTNPETISPKKFQKTARFAFPCPWAKSAPRVWTCTSSPDAVPLSRRACSLVSVENGFPFVRFISSLVRQFRPVPSELAVATYIVQWDCILRPKGSCRDQGVDKTGRKAFFRCNSRGTGRGKVRRLSERDAKRKQRVSHARSLRSALQVAPK